MASKTEGNIRRIAEIEAVQGNAGVGLTIEDVDDILGMVRIGDYPVGQVADILRPDWRIEQSRVIQNKVVERAATIIAAVRAHDAKCAKD